MDPVKAIHDEIAIGVCVKCPVDKLLLHQPDVENTKNKGELNQVVAPKNLCYRKDQNSGTDVGKPRKAIRVGGVVKEDFGVELVGRISLSVVAREVGLPPVTRQL